MSALNRYIFFTLSYTIDSVDCMGGLLRWSEDFSVCVVCFISVHSR